MESTSHWNDASQLPRRRFLALTAAAAFSVSHATVLAQRSAKVSGDSDDDQSPRLLPSTRIPMTGATHANLAPLDALMTSFVRENDVPGASLAVTRRGKLVYARGFGFADIKQRQSVQPDSLFRIASVSKPITAVAVMRLVEQGKLGLDDKVVDHMRLAPLLQNGAEPDPRWKKITVRHCLQHTGGWDRDASYDPAFRPWIIARAFAARPPVTPAQIVRYMMGQPLDFDPGRRYAYSNLGYLVLGRILEAVTGESYEAHVKQTILAPLGVERMRLGRALLANRAPQEVRYYDRRQQTGRALYPPRRGEQVPVQYGAQNLEGFEAHGGWIASSIELVRFAAAIDGAAGKPLLEPQTRSEMWAAPAGEPGHDADGKRKDAYYGCGWMVRPVGDARGQNTWHTGSIDGTEALLVRRWDGMNWAVLFNTRGNPAGTRLSHLIDPLVHKAVDQVQRWPRLDRFSNYLG